MTLGKNRNLRGLLLASAAVLSGGVSGAMAQTADDSQAGAEATAGGGGVSEDATVRLKEVVVTARKQEEVLRDVPVSIIAISGDALKESAVVRLTDLTAVVPNFTMSLAANAPVTNLRGFGTYGTQFAQSVGKFVDNVSYSRDIHSRIPLFDVERLEVLKGPQVLLYGNSTTAGALNITTRKPGDEFSADLSTSYEFNHEETITQGGVTIPINDKASVRVAGFLQNLNKGWLRNDINGDDEPTFANRAVRGTLLLEPTDQLTMTLKAEYAEIRDTGGTSQQIRQSTNPGRQLPEVTFDDHRQSATGLAPFFTEEFNGLDNEVYQADVDFESGIGLISSTTAYLKSHQVGAQGFGAGRPYFISDIIVDYEQFSQELRLSNSTDMLDYSVGGYYEWNNYDSISPLAFNAAEFGIPFAPVARVVSLDQVNKSYSVFGDFTYHLTDKIDVSAGARYTMLDQTNDQYSQASPIFPGFNFNTSRAQLEAVLDPSLNPTVNALFGGTPHVFTDIERDEDHFQPQLLVQYRPNSDMMLYGKYVKGAKQGGVDTAYAGTAAGADPAEAIFDPEFARSFEVGIKGTTANRRFEYSLSAFDTKFDDLQLQAFLGTTQFVTNVGEAQTYGVEAEFTWVPLDNLRLNGTANYLDATFQNFTNAPCTVFQAAAAAPGTVCTQEDVSGKPTPFQSEWSGTFNASYDFDTDNFQITPAISLLYRSEYNVSTIADPLGLQDGMTLIDLNLGLDHKDSGWRGSIFAKNITDEKYFEYGTATAVVTGGYSVWSSRGSSVGVQVGLEF